MRAVHSGEYDERSHVARGDVSGESADIIFRVEVRENSEIFFSLSI
jgi:hypothetical protein